MTAPSAFYDAAELARLCVCDQMAALAVDDETYPGCPCLTYVSPGEPAFDNCCEACDGTNHGQMTVQIDDVYPSANFPAGEAYIFPCRPATWVVSLKVVVARCTPSQDEQGNPPSAEAMSANAELLAKDLYAVLTALTCCLPGEAVPGKTKRRVAISAVGNATIPGEGGCAGIEVRANVEAGNVCGCPAVS